MKKKIMFVVPYLSGGGAERVVSLWSSELAELGIDTHLLLLYRVDNEYFIHDDLKVHIIAPDEESYIAQSKLKHVKLIRKVLKEVNPDVIIPFLVGPLLNISRIGLKSKLVETVRINPASSPKNIIKKAMRDISVFLSNGLIVQNTEQKEYFPQFVHKKTKVFPNPVSDLFLDIENKSREIKKIVTVGRLVPQKNHKLLIRAFSKIKRKNLKLDIYGEGILKEELQELIYELDLSDQVRLMGRVPKIEDELKTADLFVLTSNYEGMPNSLMEAMASGLPCISTDCPTGPSDLIDNYANGLLIPMENETQLINSINYLIENPDVAIEMGRQAKKDIKENYSAHKSAVSLYRYLENI